MIAVALGLISLVVMIATAVVASSGAEDRLTFLGVGVHTTTAQVFVTGAIFGWLFLVAIWLLRVGLQRSGERCAELAARRRRRPSDWLGFGDWDDVGDMGELDRVGARDRDGSGWHRGGIGSAGDSSAAGVGGTGTTRHGGGTPWRSDRRPHNTHRAVATTPDQPGMVNGDYPPSPITGRVSGFNVHRGSQRRQIGGGSGPVPGKDGRTQSEHRRGDGGQ